MLQPKTNLRTQRPRTLVALFAGRHEHSAERLNYRNGYRDRTIATRLGVPQLRIPELRQGSYFPPFLEPRRPSEKALVSDHYERLGHAIETIQAG